MLIANRTPLALVAVLSLVSGSSFADDDDPPPSEPTYEENTDDDDAIADDDDNADQVQSTKKLFVKKGRWMEWFVYQSKGNYRAGKVTVNANVRYLPNLKCRWRPNKYIILIDSTNGTPKAKPGKLGSSETLTHPVKGGIKIKVGVGTQDGSDTGCKFDLDANASFTPDARLKSEQDDSE